MIDEASFMHGYHAGYNDAMSGNAESPDTHLAEMPERKMRVAIEAILSELDALEASGGPCIPSIGVVENLRDAISDQPPTEYDV